MVVFRIAGRSLPMTPQDDQAVELAAEEVRLAICPKCDFVSNTMAHEDMDPPEQEVLVGVSVRCPVCETEFQVGNGQE